MMQFILFLLMAIFAGLLIPLQAGLNAQLGHAVKDPAYGAMLSFVVGLIGIFLYCLIARVDFAQLKGGFQIPWYYWSGGLMGAFFVVTLIVAPPKLGMALTLGVTIAAQLVLGLLVDHYGWFGVPKDTISWPKIGGVLMVIGGLFLLRA